VCHPDPPLGVLPFPHVSTCFFVAPLDAASAAVLNLFRLSKTTLKFFRPTHSVVWTPSQDSNIEFIMTSTIECPHATLHFSAISPDSAHVVILSLEQLSKTTPKIYWATHSIAWTPTPDYITYHNSTNDLSKTSNTSTPPCGSTRTPLHAEEANPVNIRPVFTPDCVSSATTHATLSDTSAPLHALPKLHRTPRLLLHPLPLHLPLIDLPPDSLMSTTVFTRFSLLVQQHHQFSMVAARTPPLTVGDSMFLHVELYRNTASSVLDSHTLRCPQYFPLWPPFTFHAAPLFSLTL
jgi:hypothetical protein